MLTLSRPSFLPASVLYPAVPRHVGFVTANRRALAIGAIAASALFTSIPSLPANADIFLGAASAAPAQTFTAPTIVGVPVVRDAFAISSYTVVQYPVPASTPISSGFGHRRCDGCDTNHTGLDFNPGNGYPIQVIADGVVTKVGFDPGGYGQYVKVQHDIDGEVVTSVYGHMQLGSQAVSEGQAVTRSQVLGLVGQTGQATGPHLHFEIIVADGVTKIDPYPWLLAHVNA